MARSPDRLARLLRIRTLAVGQVQARERAAREGQLQAQALAARIEALIAQSAPGGATVAQPAVHFAAAAHYRERLHASARAAEDRLAAAAAALAAAQQASRAARQDQNAIEKLIARAEQEAARDAMRALEALPGVARKRHESC